MSLIPKVIHYCWFGRNEKSESMQKCIGSWKKFCPDYKIIEWNEDNFNIDCTPFVREAYDAKKWAFVADYARLFVVYENGGIYLDTDVELLKSLDDFLGLHAYMGFQGTEYVNTGLGFGAEKGDPIVYEMLCDYHDRHFSADTGDCMDISCPIINSLILDKYGFVRNGEKQTVKDVTIFPRDYFDPKDCETYITTITENTHSIHHYDATWRNNYGGLKQKLIRAVVKLIGRERFLRLKSLLKGNK